MGILYFIVLVSALVLWIITNMKHSHGWYALTMADLTLAGVFALLAGFTGAAIVVGLTIILWSSLFFTIVVD